MKLNYPLIPLLLLLPCWLMAQGPGSLFVNAGPDVVIDCDAGGCTEITAEYLLTFETISENYVVESIPYDPPFAFDGLANQLNPDIDDSWSGVDDLPFDFCFFGNLETQFQVGSNGVLRFDVDPSDVGPFTNNWPFNVDIPNNSTEAIAEANVFTPVHDMDPSPPSNAEEIGYEVLGEYPNRVLVVSFYRVPMYSCNGLLATQMAVFYEFSNVIEFYIENKPVCAGWNGGNAALGIQNNDGTVGYTPPGRNTSDSPWTAVNEAWRFTPEGKQTAVFEWLDADENVISTNPTIEVCPTGTETYTARVTYSNTCNGEMVILTDDVNVTSNTPFTIDIGPDVSKCDQEQVILDATTTNPDVTYRWFRDGDLLEGETEGQLMVNYPDSGVYTAEGTDMICTLTDDALVQFLEQPVANQANDLYKCDDGSGDNEFDLRVNRPVVLGTQDTDVFSVSFHNTQDDANTGADPITEEADYPITGNNETIFVRIEERLAQVCFDTGSFELFFQPPDFVVDLGEDVDRCDEQSVELNAETGDDDSEYQWFLDGAPIGGATDAIYMVEFPDSGIYSCLVSDAFCGLTDEVRVRFLDQPMANQPSDLFQCDDGISPGEFDLRPNRAIVLGNQDPSLFSVTFHNSQEDAANGDSPIDNEITYPITGTTEEIFVRIEELNQVCYDTASFMLEFSELEMGSLTDLQYCDQDREESIELDLFDLKTDEILDGLNPDQFIISFHDNPDDAMTGDSPLPRDYTVEVPGMLIYVRLEFIQNENCIDIESFRVDLFTPPLAIPPSPFELCDEGNDGIEVFPLTDKNAEIIGDQTDVRVDYYLTRELAVAGEPTDQLPDNYQNETLFEQEIWARVSDDIEQGSGRPVCYDVVPLVLRTLPTPEIELEEQYRICVDENGDPVAEAFGGASPPFLDTGLNSFEYSFSWTLDGQPLADDDDPDLEETDPGHIATTAGTYQVVVTYINTGCSNTATTQVYNSSIPQTYSAEVIGEPFSGDYGIQVMVTGEGDYEFKLDGGAYQDDPYFGSVLAGVREVTIRDKEGCGQVSLEVVIIDFPKYFTPNQDGYHDTWQILGLAEIDPGATVYIFDRFGKLLKQIFVDGEGWDGTYDGNLLPSSDYWFLIEYKLDGVSKQYRNHFTLKR